MSDELQLNANSYEFDFFSGSQISCYIGHILVDDIKHIEFSVTQTKRPVYGYASQYYHVAAPGQVMVEGTFTVNFKEADYILATLEKYKSMAPISELDAGPGSKLTMLTDAGYKTKYMVKRKNIERIIAGETTGSPFEFYNDLAAMSDNDFEQVAEAFEDVLWKQTNNDFFEGSAPVGAENPGDMYRRGDQYGSFNIFILYGDIANAAANHTIKKIIDVDIIGQGQQIMEGGACVEEVYRFMAKNLA